MSASLLNADAPATDQTRFSAIRFLRAGFWASANETRRSGCVFHLRPNRTENIDHPTVAAATTSGIDAVSIVAGHHTFSFALRAAKAAALTRRAFRIFLANNHLIGAYVRNAAFGGLCLGIAKHHNCPYQQSFKKTC